jgi:hypothetical protein
VADAAPTSTAQPLRCLQRPTGEWFTVATANAPGRDTPDATELWTEAEARDQLAARGYEPEAISRAIAEARERCEVSGDIADWPSPRPEE